MFDTVSFRCSPDKRTAASAAGYF